LNNTNQYVFLACGPLGTADVLVTGTGILGGTSGVGGNVEVRESGTLSPGTHSQPVAELHIGGNLAFTGGSWQVDLDATSAAADVVHVAGDVVLGGAIEPVFHNAVKTRPKGRASRSALTRRTKPSNSSVPNPARC
jgi:hypothetical protein